MTRYHQDLQAQLDDWQATGKDKILKILDATSARGLSRLASKKIAVLIGTALKSIQTQVH